jgi:glycosyltransferase involved in cell wall biosynthesis
MTKKPETIAALVSVILPVYNCERYLAEALGSVQNQTYRPLDVILVDDGSKDGSAVVARGFEPSLRYCFQPRRGIGAARNHGVKLARGSFLAFLDADDRWVEHKLERQMKALVAHPELDAVFGHVKQFVSPELGKDVTARLRCPPQPMAGYVPGAMLIRRESFDRVGSFETGTKVGEFLDWCLRAVESGLRMKMLPELVLWRRLHESNQGIRERGALTDYLSILKASIDRRRSVDGGNALRSEIIRHSHEDH